MENTRKRTGWLLAAVILLITGVALVAGTLAAPEQPDASAAQPYKPQLRALFPQAERFEPADDTNAAFIAHTAGQPEGYAVRQTVQGYAGPVEVLTAFDTQGMILGVHVGGDEFRETEGLGAKAKEPDFGKQFVGRTPPVALGQEIDAIAGATVTSQAVVDAVNRSFDQLPSMVPGFSAKTRQTAKTANASRIGYGGPVLVRLTLDEENRIASLDVGGARFAETEGVGSRVREEGFTSQFTSLTPPLKLNEDIDAIAGATLSSQAAVDAVNDAYAFLMQNDAAADRK